MPKYTYATIQFGDDGTIYENQIFCADEFDETNPQDLEYDDEVFFYGMTREDLLSACKTGEIREGEWRVLSVGDSFDRLI